MRSVADSLISDLRTRGAQVRAIDDRLIVEAPRGVLTEGDRAALRTTKQHVMARLELESRLLDMSFSEFETDGCPIQIWVPWLSDTLWWVPRGEQISELMQLDVSRGRIYTAKELTNLTRFLGSVTSPDELQGIARLKLALDATIVALEETTESAAERPIDAGIRRCPACRGDRFWKSIHGAVVCGECHPPAAPELVAEWLDASSEAAP